MDKHIENLEKTETTRCGHPRLKCAKPFESVQALKLHLQDLHCVEQSKRPKRSRSQEESEIKVDGIKRLTCTRPPSDDGIKFKTNSLPTYSFVDETKRTLDRHRCVTSTPLALFNEPPPRTDCGSDEIISTVEMPALCRNPMNQDGEPPKTGASNGRSPRQFRDASDETQTIPPQMLSKDSFTDDSPDKLPGLTHSDRTSPNFDVLCLDELEPEDLPETKPNKCELPSPDDDIALFSQYIRSRSPSCFSTKDVENRNDKSTELETTLPGDICMPIEVEPFPAHSIDHNAVKAKDTPKKSKRPRITLRVRPPEVSPKRKILLRFSQTASIS